MGDSEYTVEYKEGEEETLNWLKKAGAVTITYPNGDNFVGQVNEEKLKDGKGKYTWTENVDDEVKEVATYEGEYKSGIKCGLGKMKFPSKDAYHGEWENDKMHGEGTYVYANGDIFSGKYENGIKQGEGTYEYLADQSQLIGTWKDGTIVKGIWKFKDGSEYRGEFSLGKPIGDGLYHLVNGLEQQGNYQCIADEASGESKQLWQGQRPIATVS